MAKVALLGTGLMGAALVEAMIRRGDEVSVYNRTRARAEPLATLGARVADTPADCVRDAERVHIVVSDDAAVDALLDAMVSGLAPRAVVVDHTTVSPAGTVARFAKCDALGIELLHAPVFMAPQNCRDGGGLMLCAGPRARFERVESELAKMTGSVWYVGERVDLAAAYKLFGNAMILVIVGGLTDVYEMAASLGISAPDAHALFSRFKPGGTIDVRGKRMANADFAASFDLVMARKDVRLMIEAAAGAHLSRLPALEARIDESLAKGRDQDDVGVIAKDAVERTRESKG